MRRVRATKRFASIPRGMEGERLRADPRLGCRAGGALLDCQAGGMRRVGGQLGACDGFAGSHCRLVQLPSYLNTILQ